MSVGLPAVLSGAKCLQEFGAAAAQTFLNDNGGYVTEMLI